MNYFDTVAGQRFAEYIIPSLIEALQDFTKIQSKKQYTVIAYTQDEVHNIIKREIESGARFVNLFSSSTSIRMTTLIFEK